MKNVLLQAAIKLNTNRKKRKWWQTAVRITAAVVVFCTTYALILPAITAESDPICGLEAHTHEESCYTQSTRTAIVCGQGGAHTHNSFCYNEEGALICSLPEAQAHTHAETCYGTTQTVICQDASEDHVHTEGCMGPETILICELPELAEHNHSESCRGQVTDSVLVCTLEEHVHEDACFPVKEENSAVAVPEPSDKYLCGMGVHAHGEGCLDETGALICSIPEHAHEAACIVADLDMGADWEAESKWAEMASQLTFTGNWPQDVLTMAQSQIGYTESRRNMVLEGEMLKGYTRYGDWGGLPYGDWCAMFVSFCMDYAGVQDFPYESEVNRWVDDLINLDLYAEAGLYEPKPGDVIFFDFDRTDATQAPAERGLDHVGLVAELIPATETEPAMLKTVEGNVGNQVTYVTYEYHDPAIIGYGVLPAGEKIVLVHEGVDYTVTVSFRRDAGIPETAVLAVREILPGSEEYNTYYQQSVATMLESSTAQTEEELAVSFARFFDISFLVDGQEVEPTAAVNVQITYKDGISQTESENGMAVHFASEGIELLEAETSQRAEPVEEEEKVDTFEFQQDSFSVVGTVLSAYERAIATTATTVQPYEIDNTAATLYVLYTQIGGQYYALDGNGKAIPVTLSGNTVNLGANASNDLFWTFKEAEGAYAYNPVTNVGTGKYLHPFNNGAANQGILTSNPYGTTLTVNGSSFKIRGNNQYVWIQNVNEIARVTADANQATSFYAARVGKVYNVWFDGTNGGMMSYYGADDLNIPAVYGDTGVATITLPETWKSTPKYPYKLQGWYDINTHKYYPVNPNDDQAVTAQINADTVFYADWVAASYDVGQNNSHVVSSVDTSDFITTYVFDYNVLFNVLSQTHTGTITSTGHSENWSMVNNGTVPYNNDRTLGFSFVDYDANGDFSYANGRDNTNINQGDAITAGILNEVYNASGGKDLLDLLFNPNTQVIGKNYVGTGNYLFQYMDSTTENYDGVHDGYYYLDARLNAASYNQTEKCFYLYDYLERTSDSDKDGGVGQYSDFLPFNSPYQFENHMLDNYVDSIMRPGYEYDAKDGASSYQEYNSADDATTNYFFGIRTDIEFFLPNDTNTQDEYGNYGNISTRGEHMIFDFHGDDDVWVFVDGELLLDIGGLHGVMFGQIDFSTGKVIVGKDGGTTETRSFHMSEGTHTMTVYYMERGSSQSNCAIYFNIAPRYDLEITKEDIYTAEMLDGAVFSVYNDEAMTSPAQLWVSEEAYNEDMVDGVADHATNTFTVVDGVAACWGISAGKTYYICETTPPPGYPPNNDLIRITLNNRGTATIECTTLHGPDGVPAEGFAVIKQEVNDTLKIVALTVTNQKDVETTEVRVQKTWAAGSTNLPESITVYLTANGVRVGRAAVLTEANGWAYTWEGLPKYTEDAFKTEIVYEVQEVLVPDYITTQGESVKVIDHVDWIRVAQMSDSEIYLLVHDGQALSYNGSFGWVTPEAAKLDSGKAAQWSVTTDHDGFHLKNGLGYTLTFNPSAKNFYGINNDAAALNQVIYYLNGRLVVHDHDVYYQFGTNGTAVADDGLAFTLYQKEVFTGLLSGITNVPVDEESQTYVEVTKIWRDGKENHTEDSVIISLYADGKDTGRDIVLNAANNWTGGFYDLPYFQADGTTVIEYTVVEDPVLNYIPEYAEGTVLPGLPTTIWQNASSLQAGKIYSILSGSYALAMKDGDVTSVPRNMTDLNQQWEAVNVSGTIRLRNLGTNTYLGRSSSDLYPASQSASAAITLSGGRISFGTQYLELGAGYVSATNNSANATIVAISQLVETTGKPGTGLTVTNLPASYELPHTGGTGTSFLTFGGLLMILAAACGYVIYTERKRQKGGSQV